MSTGFFRRSACLLLVLTILFGMMPATAFATEETVSLEVTGETEEAVIHEHEYESVVTDPTRTEQGYTTYTCTCGHSYVDDYMDASGHKRSNGTCTLCGDTLQGKAVSILSHSASTYAGVSNNTAYNSTIGNNDVYYTEGRHGVYLKDTWWQQVMDALDMRLIVNNSWSGSCVFMPRKGEASVGYGDRAVNLHNDCTGEEPDIIFVYLGCNDFAYFKETFGKAADVDYAALIQDNNDGTFTYAEPTTTCEAYAIMLHKVENCYPNAEIFCMTSTARRDPDYVEDNRPDTGQPTAYSAELHKVAKYFGFLIINLENCIPKEAEIFDQLMGDKRAHPNALGMDQITNEVLSVMLGTDAEIRHVTSADGIVAEQAVLLGGSYHTEVVLQKGYDLVVTMDGGDITAEAYNDGKICIEEVTGDIIVSATAKWEPKSYRWELKDGLLVSTAETENAMVRLEGTTENGIFIDTRYQLTKAIVLRHDQQWVLEWNMTGPWVDTGSTVGKKLFSEDSAQSTVGAMAIGTKSKADWLAFNFYNGSAHVHYGIDLAEYGISLSENHTYRLYNKVAEDGSNMIWLAVDGVELGAMNTHLNAGVESDYLSGKNFSFGFLGTPKYWLDNGTITYIQVQEGISAYNDNNDFRWETRDDELMSVGTTDNKLNMLAGTIDNGVLKDTKFTLDSAVVLKHNLPWKIEWRCAGDWRGMVFSSDPAKQTAGMYYLSRTKGGQLCLGTWTGSQHDNYGIDLSYLDDQVHSYQLVNRIADDGSNMVWLYMDGEEIGPMNNYFNGSRDQGKTSDWISGKDFVFSYIGAEGFPMNNCVLEYLQVWTNGHEHTYEAAVMMPTCTEQGYTTHTCACGDSYVDDYVAATGNHSYEEGICIDCGEAEPDMIRPTLTLQSPTLEFMDMISIVAFFTAENTENVVEMGMITYKYEVDEWNVENAAYVMPGAAYAESSGRYYATSQGIHAKQLSDEIYLAIYAKLSDGSYVYSKLVSYSATTYAYNQLEKSDNVKLKQLVVSMLNYGTEAQLYFVHNVQNLASAKLTEAQKALPEVYRADMVQSVPAVSKEKQGAFLSNRGFASRRPAVSFEGAFCIHYFFTPAYAPVGDITLYYWNEADFNAAEVLTVENASGALTMVSDDSGQYRGDIAGIAAKNLSGAIYVAAVYSDGTGTWTSGVLGYSIGAYCTSQASNGSAVAELAKATAVYGYHAKGYFG